jgi:4-carboxymuconolactone decarboxylase
MTARIPYKEIPERLARNVPPEGQLNVMRMVVHAEEAWPYWMKAGSKLLTATVLEPRLRELIIVRIGHLQNSPYEVAQHDPLARQLGVAEVQLEALSTGDTAVGLGFSETETAALAAVTELLEGKQVSDHTFSRLHGHLGDRGVVEMLLLVAQYAGLALFLNALQVDIDPAARLIV